MLYAGKQITSSADQLSKVPLDYLYHSIRNPKEEIVTKIRNLRIIRDIDKKRYTLLKKELPYLVCGAFNPPFRRTENFAYIEYFIVDIDHITQKGLSIENIRGEIEKDSRTVMSFLSPGEDGLKVLFHLKERCCDSGLYSLFYKVFVQKFSTTYRLDQVIDAQTSDVCRACFVSYDPNVYFNPEAETVDVSSYIDEHNPVSLFDMKAHTEKVAKEQKLNVEPVEKDKDPDDESIQKIKAILQLKSRPVEKNPAYIPEQLNDVIEDIRLYIENTGIKVTEIININYAKKIRMQLGLKQAEINVFYGKRGYSVVISPRSGTSAELNELAASVISSFFAEMEFGK
ncbi:MAG: CRISPR-associated primase-polymerase type B [Bacteroidaceae bacterium]